MNSLTPTRACPAWCKLADGHHWDDEDDQGRPTRLHGHPLQGVAGVELEIVQREHEQRAVFEAPGVYVFSDGDRGLAPAELRALSDRLRVVADELEAIQHQAIRDALKGSQDT